MTDAMGEMINADSRHHRLLCVSLSKGSYVQPELLPDGRLGFQDTLSGESYSLSTSASI